VLEFAEVAFDEIARAIDKAGDASLDRAVFLGGNVGPHATRFDALDQGARVIAAIGHDMAGPCQPGDELGADAFVGGLTLRQGQADRQAMFVHNDAPLGAQSPNEVARRPAAKHQRQIRASHGTAGRCAPAHRKTSPEAGSEPVIVPKFRLYAAKFK